MRSSMKIIDQEGHANGRGRSAKRALPRRGSVAAAAAAAAATATSTRANGSHTRGNRASGSGSGSGNGADGVPANGSSRAGGTDVGGAFASVDAAAADGKRRHRDSAARGQRVGHRQLREAELGGGSAGKAADLAEPEALLARYRRRRNVRLRNQIIEQLRGTVEAMARQLLLRLPRSVDIQDLVHAGIGGLMRAIDTYRPEVGSAFVPFMRIRVRGAMLDELRNMDFLPRLYRSRLRARDAAESRLRDRLLRDPSDAEVATELGVSERSLWRLYSAMGPLLQARGTGNGPVHGGTLSPASGDGDGGEDDAQSMDSLADDDSESPIDALDRRELLAKIEHSLQPIEWAVLRLHYFDGLSGKEVAKRLRLSASRICQIHGRVLTRLKARLGQRDP